MYTLKEDLDALKLLFSAQKLQAYVLDSEASQRYYNSTRKLYRWFHSQEGAMHFPLYLNRADNHTIALQNQLDIISLAIHHENVKKVVEMGCGMGFNTLWWAKKYPHTKVVGLDIHEKNLSFARKRGNNMPNLNYQLGDWNVAEPEVVNADVLFAIESFCYVKNLHGSFKKIADMTCAGARVLIFDAFKEHTNGLHQASEWTEAIDLTAWGFAVNQWHKVEEVITIAKEYGFRLVEKKDYTPAIMPNLLRLQRDMQKLIRNQWFKAALLCRTIPVPVQGHIISGLLSAHTMQAPAHRYFMLHFIKH